MKKIFAALVAALLMVSLVSGVALAAPKPTSLWSVYNINSGGAAYTPKAAPGVANSSAANFDFPSDPTTALLTTSKDRALLGDLTGKTITATFTIIGTTPVFTYAGTCGSTPPSVRLYFAGDTTGKFTYDTAGFSKYWWSNPQSYTLASVVGQSLTLTVPITSVTQEWSDWGGELAPTVPNAFANAAAHVSAIGLSFGGGCFFANGVGLSSGNASFSLTSYSIAP